VFFSSVKLILKTVFQRYRTSVVKELLATEETYVKDLDTAIIVFLHPLRALFCDPIFVKREESHLDHPEERIRRVNFEPPKDDRAKEKKVLLTEDLLQTMFGNLEDILERHRALLASLRKAVQEWSPVQTLGNIFIELVGFSLKTSVTFSLFALFSLFGCFDCFQGDSALVGHYVSYCNNFDNAIKTLDDCKEKSEKFRQFLETTSTIKRVKKYQLAAFLTLPVQRLPRYVLLLRVRAFLPVLMELL